MQKNLAVALDIGTTNIEGALVDVVSRKTLSQKTITNEQVSYGHDVITRLGFAVKKQENLKVLNSAVISSINKILNSLCDKDDLKAVSRIVAVGNSAMYHLTLNIDPASLTTAPFRPKEKGYFSAPAKDLGIRINPGAVFEFLPIVDGFVGSDALAIILATGLHKETLPVLAVDIGTNGEIVLGNKDGIFAASTAAGPAFEGWHLSCGMPAADGAIYSLKLVSGRLQFKVVGDSKPKGICGSGFIDAISFMRRLDELDRTGRLEQEFIIYKDRNKTISINQEDVRQIQLAKGAILAGINILMMRSKLKVLSRVVITGKFGFLLDKENILNIRLLPDIEAGKIEFLKSGALEGVKIFLFEGAKDMLDPVLKNISHIELHKDGSFQNEFAHAMSF